MLSWCENAFLFSITYLFIFLLSPCYFMVHEFVGKFYFGGFANKYSFILMSLCVQNCTHTIHWLQIKILDWIFISRI